jgi:RHS repeat-associated protein
MGCPKLHTKKMYYCTKGVQGLFVGFKKSGAKSYGYGFNGKEKDNEVMGTGNSLDFGARVYDSRLGRWLSLDPLQAQYPNFSPYAYCANSPLILVDLDGKQFFIAPGPGEKPTKADKELFKMLNARAGKIFKFNDKTGEVTLKKNKSADIVKNTKRTSRTLAQAIAAGTGDKVQDVYYRATDNDNLVDVDKYKTGQVDVGDLREVDKGVQAVFLTHFITERNATAEYESKKEQNWKDHVETRMNGGDIKNTEFGKAHNIGISSEIKALNDVTGGNATSVVSEIKAGGVMERTYDNNTSINCTVDCDPSQPETPSSPCNQNNYTGGSIKKD